MPAMSLTPDQRVDRFAAGHHGLITRAEAFRLGLSNGQIHRRLAAGRLIVAASGVYRVPGAPVTWRQLALAACWSGPPDTSVSHVTAAAMADLTRPPSTPQLTVPRGTSGRIRGARVHWSPLDPLDRTIIDGIPTTSVARTLIDCAGLIGFGRLCDLVDSAFCSGVCHPAVIPAAIERAQAGRGRKGVTALRAAIEAWTPGIAPGSPAELRLLRTITEAGLEPPERQVEVFDADGEFIGRIEVGWRRLRAGFEYDSDRYHGPRHWARDESRQVRYAHAGWDVRRVGKLDLLPSVAWLDQYLRTLLLRRAA
jgi:Transcriptional regulator, AbiEi antitoxin